MAVPLRSSAVRDRADGRLWSRYRTYPPDVSVRAYSRCAWSGTAAWERSIRLLPDGCVDLVARDSRLFAVVPLPGVRRIRLGAADHPAGLRVRCGAAGTLLDQDLSALPAGELELTALPDAARRALDAGDGAGALDAFVRARLRAGRTPDPVVLEAVRRLRLPGARVDLVAVDLELSPRTLHRRVRGEVGFGPKQLHRVFRFQHVLAGLPRLATGRTGLAELAAACGYADQSHLGRECRRLADTSPATLVATWTRMSETFQTGG